MAQDSLATSGHGMYIEVALNVATLGTLSRIAEVMSDEGHGGGRAETEVTPHEFKVDAWIVSNVLGRVEVTFDVNYIVGSATQGIAAGLEKLVLDGSLTLLRITGPDVDGVRPAVDIDDWAVKGYVKSANHANPVREGGRSSTFTFRPSGGYTQNGVDVGGGHGVTIDP